MGRDHPRSLKARLMSKGGREKSSEARSWSPRRPGFFSADAAAKGFPLAASRGLWRMGSNDEYQKKAEECLKFAQESLIRS
jgi:hypothetical protein